MNQSRLSTLPLIFGVFFWTMMILNIMLSTLIRWRKTERQYPAFSACVYMATVKVAVLFGIAKFGTNVSYGHAYYIASAITSVFIAACAAEIYMKVFGPRMALPPWAFRNISILLPTAMVSSVIVAALLGSLKGSQVARVMWTAQQCLFFATCAAFVTLLAYSRRLSIGWPTRVAGIAYGFVLVMSVNMVTAVVIGRAGRSAATTAAVIGQSANVAALAWWVWRFWEKEPEPARATREQVQTMLEWHKQTLEAMGHSSTQEDQKVIQL